MGLHLVPLLAAGAVGALVVNQTSNEKGLLHDTAVSITAGVLNIKDSIENNFEELIEEAEAKNNKNKINKDIN